MNPHKLTTRELFFLKAPSLKPTSEASESSCERQMHLPEWRSPFRERPKAKTACVGALCAAMALQTIIAAESNDHFVDRARISGNSIAVASTTVDATREPNEPNHAGHEGGSSLWWIWSPTEEGYAVVDTQGSSFDTLLGVYFGKQVDSLSVIATNDDAINTTASRVGFDAFPDLDYSIAVDGKAGASGPLKLNLRLYTTPEILGGPESLEVTDGDSAVFAVEALGKNPLSYQWQRAGTNLPGENQSRLLIPVTSKAMAGAYRVIVRNSVGAVTSAPPAVLRVVERPKIVEHPQDARKEDGDAVVFSVRALGEQPLTYAWQFKLLGVDNYLDLPGRTLPELRLENLSTDEAGFYRVRVTNAYGQATSDGAHLQVDADRPRIAEPLTNRTVVEVTNVLFSAKVRGHRPLQFRWFRDGVVIPNETGPNLLIDPARTNSSGLYRFEVRNRYGTNTSQDALLTVEPRPPNDHLARRIDLSFETNVVYGFNKNGTVEAGEPAHAGQPALHSVWWSYQATNRGVVTVDLEGSTIDTVLSAYRLTNTVRLVRVADNDDTIDPQTGSTRFQSRVQFLVSAGEEYVIAVDGKGGAEADWRGNDGKGGLAVKLHFTTDFGAPLFGGGLLDFFLFGGGGGGGNGDCGDATFTLQAESLVPFGYQWEYNLRCLSASEMLTNSSVPPALPGLLEGRNWLGGLCTEEDTWVKIPGATNDTLVLTNLTIEHIGQYRLVAANLGVPGASTSAPTTLVVSPLPIITTNLPPTAWTRDCGHLELLFVANGGCYPFTNEWYFNGQRIQGATNKLLVFTNAHPTQSGSYFAVARASFGGTTSAVCQVTIDATPWIKTQPRSLTQTANDCDELALSVELEPACRESQFQWLLNGRTIAGATNATHYFRATAETAGDYQVRIFNDYAFTNSAVAKVPVDARPFILEHPESAEVRRVLVGSSFTNTVRVQSCSELIFQWRRNGIPILPDANHVVVQELVDPERSIVRGLLIVHQAAPEDSGRYDVVVSSGTGSVTSRPGDIEVLYRPPNDDFADRIGLTSTLEVVGGTNFFSASTRGTNILASAEPEEPEHALQPPRRSVWWTWTSPAPSLVTLDTEGSNFDTLLSVYRENRLPELVRVMDNDQSEGNNTSKAVFLAARNRVLQIAVDGSSGAQGTVFLQLKAEEIVSPPIILKQPRSLAATNGATATFSVQTYGSPDILHQWAFNGTPISGATNAALTITNVQEHHEGNYTVHLLNEYGETNSSIARLTFGIIIEGQVTDATNRRGIQGARVSVGDAFTYTDTNGNYILVGVRPGAARADFDARKRVVRLREPVQFNNRSTLSTLHLHAERDQYFDYDDYQFEAQLGQTVTNKFSMSPVFDGVRFVLNWDLEPADLDAHLLTPVIGDTSYHVQYPLANRGNKESPPFATLDFDVQDSYGPETLTMYRLEDGIYRFFVKKFDPNAHKSLSASRAVIKVYNRGALLGDDGLYASREVPNVGEGSVWHVCDIDGKRRSITWMDELLAADPPLPPQGTAGGEQLETSKRREARESSLGRHQFSDGRFEWDFGDGGRSSEFEPAHAYSAPGQYTVKLFLFGEAPGGTPLSVAVKTNFITVYNEEPVVTLTSPPEGWLYKVGDNITLEADAFDLDGEVRRVEFLLLVGNQTHVLGTDSLAPYRLEISANEPGPMTFQARAVDEFGSIGWSEPVTVRVLDLTGDVLIVRNFDHPEIDQMAERLEEIQVPTPEGWARNLVVRVLDQEGLYFDLVRDFRLIIWNDQGELSGGLSDADVDLFQAADAAGIPLYLMGDRLGTSLYQLGPTLSAWASLSHLLPPPSYIEGGTVTPTTDRVPVEFFGPGARYGDVAEFIRPSAESENFVLADNLAEVVAWDNEQPVMLRYPAFSQPDFGEARRVVQSFRVADGDDPLSLEERRKLYLNTTAWLLRLDCQHFGGFLDCGEVPLNASVGQPVEFHLRVTQNGVCGVGGILVTNELSPALTLQSYQIIAGSGREDTNSVRVELEGNRLIWRFSRLQSGDQYDLHLTAIPRRGGVLTNRHVLSFGLLSREPCQQILNVEGPGCDAPVKLEAAYGYPDQLSLTLTGQAGCDVLVEMSMNLNEWDSVEQLTLDSTGHGQLVVPANPSHRFFRVRAP